MFDIGLGIAKSAKSGKFYAVQNFGRPQSKEIKFRITNKADVAVTYTIEGKNYSIEPRYALTHRVCRPTEIKFRWPEAKESAPSGEELKPESGSHYAIRKTKEGKYKVEKE